MITFLQTLHDEIPAGPAGSGWVEQALQDNFQDLWSNHRTRQTYGVSNNMRAGMVCVTQRDAAGEIATKDVYSLMENVKMTVRYTQGQPAEICNTSGIENGSDRNIVKSFQATYAEMEFFRNVRPFVAANYAKLGQALG